MANPGPVLKLKPVTLWNREVAIDFRGFFANLGKAAVSGASGRLDAAFKSGIDAAKSITLKDLKAQEAAALLLGRATQRAVVRLVEESLDQLRPGFDAKKVADDLDLSLDEEELEIDEAFLRNPPRFALLKSLQESFRVWLIGTGSKEAVAGSISGRLHAYFVDQLHQEWVDHEALYVSIDTFFGSRTAEGPGRLRAWDQYYAGLQKQVDEPLFSQPFSLRQCYVPLRAFYENVPDNLVRLRAGAKESRGWLSSSTANWTFGLRRRDLPTHSAY